MNTASELLLGVDIGTGSSKGALCRPDGECLATAERPHDTSLPRPGWVEHDAEEIWWKDFTSICSELLEKADGPVAALCVSGIGPCLLPADADGRPLRPGILYGVDTRASREVQELTERYGNEKVIEVCGNPLTSQSVGPKILWLIRNEPDVWERTRYVFMAHTFIAHRLTAEYVLDHVSASMCEPLYDVRHHAWMSDWVQEVAPGLELPRLGWTTQVAGEVTQEAAAETGLPAGIPVTFGATDAWTEAVSVGVREPGALLVMYGSTMTLIEVAREPLPTPKLWSTAGCFPDTHVLAGSMSTSGSITKWLRDLLGGTSFEELTAEATRVAPGSGGLLVLPYFAGERTPISDPDARGVICGLTLSHGRGHVYRALLEATAFGTKHLLEAMHEAGGEADRYVAVGGGTKGGLWTQIVSDVTGEPQQLAEQTIGASYGDALVAGIASGLLNAGADWTNITDTVEPNPNNRDIYEQLYGYYKDLYPATRPIAHSLAGMQRAVPDTESV
jgi:xylulokinase